MDGVLLCDKPAGMTSHDVVAIVRRRIGRRAKVGHAGTLDPFATGLLLVLVGRATRTQRALLTLPKSYLAEVRFGAISSTGDPEGEIVETGVVPGELALPTGEVRQRPPAHSAVKVDGERAYRRARRGEDVELPERTVVVERFELLSREGDRAAFAIDCSSGTYVRSLIADLGDAYCTSLRRTAIGPFHVEDAAAPDADDLLERLLPLERALAFLPRVRLAGGAARRASHGVAVPAPDPVELDGAQLVLLLDDDGAIALAEPREGGELKPVVGFRS